MLDKINQPGHARQLSGDIPIYHRYTMGLAGDRFFRAMRDRQEILASPCPKCRDNLLPPKIYCERCFVETSDDWLVLEGPGYVRSFTVVHKSLDEDVLDTPIIVALVSWAGVRGGLVHQLQEIAPDQVALKMMVEPVWAEERVGALSDISHFRPARTRNA